MISTGAASGPVASIAAANARTSPPNADSVPPAVAVVGVTPLSRPAGRIAVAGLLSSKMPSIALRCRPP